MIKPKQSTSRDFAFRAIDTTGTAVTGKVTGDWTKRIRKEGGSWGAMTVTITEGENGWYHGNLSSSHTDTLGILLCNFTATGVAGGGSLIFEVLANLTSDVVALLPTALVSGRIDASVGAMASGTLTATAIAADAITAAKVAADVTTEITSGLATATNVSAVTTAISALLPSALVGGKIDAHVNDIAAGAITATAIAADAITAAKVAADVTTEITSGLATASGVTSATAGLATASALSTLSTTVAALPSAATIGAAVWAVVLGGSQTAKGMLRRCHAALAGKGTGLLGTVATFKGEDDTTTLLEATQDIVAGTREAPSTRAGD